MHLRAAAWAAIALVVGLLVQIDAVRQTGSLEASLRTGSEAPARPFIEADLGSDLPVTIGGGHDGYHFYLAATDPFALDDQRRDVYQAYRHRRVLGPLIGGLGGSLSGRPAIVGLSVVGLLGFALAAGSTSIVAETLGVRRWAPLGVITNVGLILSLHLLTADALATGLAMAGIAALLRDRTGAAVVLMTGAVLAKEPFILFGLAASSWLWKRSQPRRALAVTAIPLLVWGAWIVYLDERLGNALETQGNLDWPFLGWIQAIDGWQGGSDLWLGVMATMMVVAAASTAVIARQGLLRRLAAVWVAVAILSSIVVWEFGNNAARVFAPAWVIAFLLAAYAAEVADPTDSS